MMLTRYTKFYPMGLKHNATKTKKRTQKKNKQKILNFLANIKSSAHRMCVCVCLCVWGQLDRQSLCYVDSLLCLDSINRDVER